MKIKIVLLLNLMLAGLHAMEKEEKPIVKQFFTFNEQLWLRYTSKKNLDKFNTLFNAHVLLTMPFVPIVTKDTDSEKEISGDLCIDNTWNFTWDGLPLSLAQEKQIILETQRYRYEFTQCAQAAPLLAAMIEKFKHNPVVNPPLHIYKYMREYYALEHLYALVQDNILEKKGIFCYAHGKNGYFANHKES